MPHRSQCGTYHLQFHIFSRSLSSSLAHLRKNLILLDPKNDARNQNEGRREGNKTGVLIFLMTDLHTTAWKRKLERVIEAQGFDTKGADLLKEEFKNVGNPRRAPLQSTLVIYQNRNFYVKVYAYPKCLGRIYK